MHGEFAPIRYETTLFCTEPKPNSPTAYMSHFDKLVRLPEGFAVIAKTANSEFAGIAHQTKPIFGEYSSPSPFFRSSIRPPFAPYIFSLFCFA
jgi:hypothetical protein